jgi:hypothetical protein
VAARIISQERVDAKRLHSNNFCSCSVPDNVPAGQIRAKEGKNMEKDGLATVASVTPAQAAKEPRAIDANQINARLGPTVAPSAPPPKS